MKTNTPTPIPMIARTPITAPTATPALLTDLLPESADVVVASLPVEVVADVLDSLELVLDFEALEDDGAGSSSGLCSRPVVYTEKYSPNRLPHVS